MTCLADSPFKYLGREWNACWGALTFSISPKLGTKRWILLPDGIYWPEPAQSARKCQLFMLKYSMFTYRHKRWRTLYQTKCLYYRENRSRDYHNVTNEIKFPNCSHMYVYRVNSKPILTEVKTLIYIFLVSKDPRHVLEIYITFI